ncbi:hypothetical protein KNHN1_11600 [Pseudomonas guariconensis]
MVTVQQETDLDQIAELVWLLAECQGKPDARAATLQAVATLLDADHIASVMWDERGQRPCQPCAFNIDGYKMEAYQQHFHRVDMVTPVMRRVAKPACVDCHVPRPALLHSEIYNDFLRPADMEHGRF